MHAAAPGEVDPGTGPSNTVAVAAQAGYVPGYTDGYVVSKSVVVSLDFAADGGFALRNTAGFVMNSQGATVAQILDGAITVTGPADLQYVFFNAETLRLECFRYDLRPAKSFVNIWFVGIINPMTKQYALNALQLVVNGDAVLPFSKSQADVIAQVGRPGQRFLPAAGWINKNWNATSGSDGIFFDRRCVISATNRLTNIRLNLATAGTIRLHLLDAAFNTVQSAEVSLPAGVSDAMIPNITYNGSMYVGVQNITGAMRTIFPGDNPGMGYKKTIATGVTAVDDYSFAYQLETSDYSATLPARVTAIEGQLGSSALEGDLSAIIASGRSDIRLAPREYTLSSTLDIPSGTRITGVRGRTIIRVLETAPIGIRIKNAQDVTLQDVTIIGAAPDTPTQAGLQPAAPGMVDSWNDAYREVNKGMVNGQSKPQIGVSVDTSEKIEIYGCEIKNFSSYGLNVIQSGKNYRYAIRIENNWINNCYCGIKTQQEAERSNYIANVVSLCQIGIYIDSGTNMFTACAMEANRIGMVLGNGYNHAHGEISDCPMTHCSLHGLVAVGIQYGQILSGCKLGYTDGTPVAYIKDCRGVFFVNGVIVNGTVAFDGVWKNGSTPQGVNGFRGNTIVGWGSVTYDPATTPLILKDNVRIDGSSNSDINNS
jgi:hypothetical protein